MYIVGKGLSTRQLDIIFCVNNCRDAMDKNLIFSTWFEL